MKPKLNWKKIFQVFQKNLQRPQTPEETSAAPLCLLKEKCGDARTVCKEKVRSPENFKKTKNNPDPKNYRIPRRSNQNQKQEQVSQIKDKGKPKTKFSSPTESAICWPDKSILRTRTISLVSENSLVTKGQTNLSFSRHLQFINKYYKSVKILPQIQCLFVVVILQSFERVAFKDLQSQTSKH